MGVLTCDRFRCDNVMCDRYSYHYGYICNDCFDELMNSTLGIETFMLTRPNREYNNTNRIEELNNEFEFRE